MEALFSSYALLLFMGMALITYGFRFGGLMLGDRLPQAGLAAYLLARVPGLVLVAVFLPAAVRLGWPGWVAGLACALLAWRTGSASLALVLGIAMIALARALQLMPAPLF